MDIDPVRETSSTYRILVTVPATTLLGVDDAPAMLEGTTPIPAEQARQLAAGESTWQRILTDPITGAHLPVTAETYHPTAQMRLQLRLRHPVCAVPGCTRATVIAAEDDHIIEYDHDHPGKGGQTSPVEPPPPVLAAPPAQDRRSCRPHPRPATMTPLKAMGPPPRDRWRRPGASTARSAPAPERTPTCSLHTRSRHSNVPGESINAPMRTRCVCTPRRRPDPARNGSRSSVPTPTRRPAPAAAPAGSSHPVPPPTRPSHPSDRVGTRRTPGMT